MKTLETNPNESPHPNSLMLLIWYLISTSHIPPSLALSHCPEHTVAFVPCLCTFPTEISFINFLVYSICLLSLTLSFHALFGVFFSKNFQTSFHFKFLIFLLIYLDHERKITIKKERKQNHYTNRRQTMESPPLGFSQVHPQTPPYHLCSPLSWPLLPSSISAPSWP